ncbi:L-threonine synthase [Candidatus Koribacter versatilis Ellin345]|uniref:L-threonine synthase n=1 Tax=Koribacter versatilis (strain Ellin345) TaxID=204669 RepID=Q1IJB6_KORVE|nr:threonine synthase [Candidatus Koribacter versatilis]ABF43034.1 L-threonine synthase [Candidatus Koribacter versatilis Ellin345]
MAKISHFECARCGEKLAPATLLNVCPKCAGPLWVRYEFGRPDREAVKLGPATMWRYSSVLPDVEPVTLGEGFTPMLPSRKHANVFIKDEGLNPTGSFKARGLGMGVTMARFYGVKKIAIPSAGNAASALAAYCAAAKIEAHIFMPKDVPMANRIECESYGAHVTYVDGLISDCAKMVAERKQAEGWFDISTLKEPFRVEGKKTMGYEVAEQLGWELPDAIIYPTGGGVGLLGMWKAFEEMEQLGWIGSKRPKMICAQATGCAPVVKAWEEHRETMEMWKDAHTSAAGLRVPKPYADREILHAMKASGGTAVAVTDDEIMAAFSSWAREEGVFAAPEGAAALAAYWKLIESGYLRPEEKVVLFNTGSGLKYIDVFEKYFRKKEQPKSRALGGIIQPY